MVKHFPPHQLAWSPRFIVCCVCVCLLVVLLLGWPLGARGANQASNAGRQGCGCCCCLCCCCCQQQVGTSEEALALPAQHHIHPSTHPTLPPLSCPPTTIIIHLMLSLWASLASSSGRLYATIDCLTSLLLPTPPLGHWAIYILLWIPLKSSLISQTHPLHL